MMKNVISVFLFILMLAVVACSKTDKDIAQPLNKDGTPQETVASTKTENANTETTTTPVSNIAYTRLNMDDSKPVTGLYRFYDGKAGIIDSNGRIVCEPKYNGASFFGSEYAVMSTTLLADDEKEYHDIFGDKIDPDSVYSVSTFVDSDGKEVFGYFADATGFSQEGLAVVKDAKGHFHTMDKSGNIVSTLDNENIAQVEMIHEGMALFRTHDRKYGYLNDKLEIVIEPEFSYGRAFSEGLAYVWQDGKNYYIDKSGSVVIELPEEAGEPWEGDIFFQGADRYDAWDFSDGLAYVFLPARSVTDENGNETWVEADGYYIDKNGNKVLEIIAGTKFVNGLAAAYDKETGKCGYIDKSGKFVIAPQYTAAYTDVVPVIAQC